MTTRDLDRLVTRTELNPFVKLALRRVRRAIESGEVTEYKISKRKWSVRVANPNGLSCTWTFTMKDTDGSDSNSN
jgi:hypothetical protein